MQGILSVHRKNLEYPTTNQILFIGSNALVTIG